jgi:hypothetical protein
MAAAGIDMLPAAAGIPIVRLELTADATTREQVVGGRLGVLTAERHPTGGLDRSSLDDAIAARPLVTDATLTLDVGLVAEVEIDPSEQPFVDHHRIDGTPVLPGVMGMELFAQVATLLYPDRSVVALEDVDFLAPVKFYRDEPRTLQVSAQYMIDGDDVVAECRLVGERRLANQDEPQRTTHFTGRVRLAAERPTVDPIGTPEPGERSTSADDIYRIYFHGPAYQVLDTAWRTDGLVAGVLRGDLPAAQFPDSAATTTAPRLTELCFQTAGVWEIGTTGRMALPLHIDRLLTIAATEPDGRAYAVVDPGDNGFTATVVDDAGSPLLRLEGYRTIPLPGTLDDGLVAPLRDAMEG